MEQIVDDEKIDSPFGTQIYDPSALRKPEHVGDIGREAIGLHHIFGQDVGRRNNLHLIEDDRIIYASSAAVILEDLKTGKKDYILAVEENGIGCVVVHPSRNFFAVGGRGFQPNIYIYSYPDMKIRKILRNGAERGYACMSFSADGQKLASVSIAPDYMLTIWDWEQEQMGLHAKAFGQDVWNVQFSIDDPRRLTTSGIGHIRFWKMAATFTGLKLQGSIGKFGKIDLSDIEHFVELPDGKVVSGTETGSLLLWEGNFIKCRFVQSNNLPCHDSPITFLSFDRDEKCIISASLDGRIRWWDFATIDTAEVDSDHSMDFVLKPVVEYRLAEDVGIKAMIDSGYIDNLRLFVVIDTHGRGQAISFSLIPIDSDGNKIFHAKSLKLIDVIRILEDQGVDGTAPNIVGSLVETKIFSNFHASGISGVDACPVDHLAATCGLDGVVRCVDYLNRRVVCSRRFETPATCLRWLGTTLDSTGKSFAVGFADGIVRIISLGSGLNGNVSLIRRMVFKPHNDAVTEISFTDSGKFIATAGRDGIVFFQRCKPLLDDRLCAWDPIRFISIPSYVNNKSIQLYCEALSWSPNEKQILMSCNDGICREIDVSDLYRFAQESADLPSSGEPNDENESQSEFSYEIALPGRDIIPYVQALGNSKSGVLTIVKPSSSESHSDSALSEVSPESPMKGKVDQQLAPDPITRVSLRVNRALHAVNRAASGYVGSASLSITQHILCECNLYDSDATKQLSCGVYSVDGKDSVTHPLITTLRYGWSKKYLVVGAADGSLMVRPSEYLEIFSRTTAQNGSNRGVSGVALSFDDRYLLSVGKDGCMVVNRIRLDVFAQKAQNLFKDIDAGVFGNDSIKKNYSTNNLTTPEPRYLSFVSSYISTEEDQLFAASVIGRKEENILQKGLYCPIEEYPDLSSSSYSIQDNQLKAEEDAKRIAAEDLKNRIKASIRTLQKDYEKIIKENESIPESVRLSSKDLTVDQEYFNILNSEGQELLAEVHRECTYDAEKSEKLLCKIKNRLMHGLLIEEIPLKAFEVFDQRVKARQVESVVYSLRTSALDPAVVKIINQVKAQLRHQELLESQQRSNDVAQKKALDAMEDMKQRLQQKKDEQSVGQNGSTSDNKMEDASKLFASNHGGATSASSAVARRMKRKERKEEISRHEQQKPSENDDDVRDIQAIKYAEKTMGDFKLKCADDYEVPEEHRINANKKLKQMAMLEDSMFSMRLQFNDRFLSLRHLKQEMVYAIRRNNQRIRDIDKELNQVHLSRILWEPSLNPEEFPEDYEEVTIDELLEFMTASQSSSWDRIKAPKHKVVVGNKLEIVRNKKSGAFEVWRKTRDIDPVSESKDQLENFLCESSLVNHTPSRSEPLKFFEVKECLLNLPPAFVVSGTPNPATPASPVMSMNVGVISPYEISMAELNRLQTLEANIPVLKFTKSLIRERMQTVAPSTVQQKLNIQRRQKLEFERKMILSTMEENISSFRDAVDDLRIERHQIIGDLKLAEFKLLTLYQEYQLLQTFEFRDNTLQQKQIRCKNEETEIVALAYENKMKLETKLEEIQHWNEKLSHLVQEFKSLLPDNHPYLETLTKIFKKKIKRSKGGEDDNEEEEEEEEEEEDDDEDDDDDEEVEDICPPGCDQSLFDKILDLREKKLDTEEICNEIQKSIDDLKKTGDRLRQREKQIGKETQQTEIEVQQFQLQKQAALNQIKVVVPLRLSQLYSFELSGVMTGPTDKANGSDELAEKVEDLKSYFQRELVPSINMKSHSLFSTRNLIRLKDRISELHHEIEDAKDNFKLLHKERAQLLKDRESKELETQNWKNKCLDLQMLKFGREIDLDELETFSDRTKELEVESLLEQDREKFELECQKLMKEVASAKEELVAVTKENTKLLDEVARLTNLKISIAKDLNAPGQSLAAPTLLEDFREVEERKRIKAYTQFQATELESLRAELNMLKRKEAPIFSYSSPPLPPHVLQSMTVPNPTRTRDDVVLPPIPSNKRK